MTRGPTTRVSIQNCLKDVDFLEKRTEKVRAGAYLVSITENISSYQKVESKALLIFNNYFLVLLWRNQCFYVFDSLNKDENGNVSAAGTKVLLKFESLSSLENYILPA